MTVAVLLAALLLQDPALEQAWAVELDDIILGTPVVENDLVIAASRKGTVSAFKLAGGEPAWSVDAKGSVVSGLLVLKDKVFVPAGANSLVLEPKTGKVLKDKAPGAARAVAGPSRLYLFAGLTFDDGYRLGFSSDIAAYDPPASKPLWRENPTRLGVTAAVEAGARLFVASQYHIFVLDARSGRDVGQIVREDTRTPGVPYHGIVPDKERIVFLSDKVLCYQAKNLKEAWTAPVKGSFSWIPPLLAADRLLVFPLPDVVALDPKTGAEAWTLKLAGDAEFCTSPPALRGTEVVVGAQGKLHALDAATGKATWAFDAGKPEPACPVPQPVWSGDRLIYVVGKKVLCFKPK